MLEGARNGACRRLGFSSVRGIAGGVDGTRKLLSLFLLVTRS